MKNRRLWFVLHGGIPHYAHRALACLRGGEVPVTQAPVGALQTLAAVADCGGLRARAVRLLSGPLLTGVSITGFLIWSKRTLKEFRHSVPRRRGGLRHAHAPFPAPPGDRPGSAVEDWHGRWYHAGALDGRALAGGEVTEQSGAVR